MIFIQNLIEKIDPLQTTTDKFVNLAKILFTHTSLMKFRVFVFSPKRDTIREISCIKGKENQINMYSFDDVSMKSLILNCDHPEILSINKLKYYISKESDSCACEGDCNFNKNSFCMLSRFFCFFSLEFENQISEIDFRVIEEMNSFIKKFLFQSLLDKKVVDQHNRILKLEKEISLTRSIRDELSKQNNINASLMKFCNLLKQHLNLAKVEICLYKENQIPIRVGIGFSKDTMDMLNRSGILQRVIKRIQDNPEPYFMKDTTKMSKPINKNIAKVNDVKSYINYPLILENKVIGHIHVARSFEQKPLNDYSLYLVGVMATASVSAFRNALHVEKIKHFNETLEKEIDTATVDLRTANKQLRQLDELKSDFVNVVSHELRTPMTSIKGYIDLILMSQENYKLDEQLKEFLHIIKSEADRLTRLVNDMLDINKIESGKVEINKENFSMEDLENHLSTLKFHFNNKHIELNKEFGINNLVVDQDRFCQIITNLLMNAVKFSADGSKVDFKIQKIDSNNNLYYNHLNNHFLKQFDSASSNVDLMGFENFSHFFDLKNKSERQLNYEYFLSKILRDYILVSVKDYGTGIDISHMSSLFNKFSQIPSKARDAVGGTGLGLVISKRLINMHGGEIFVDSKLNDYSEFFFILPNIHKTM